MREQFENLFEWQCNLAMRTVKVPELLRLMIDRSFDLVNELHGHWSDDGIDYARAASNSYATTVQILRDNYPEDGVHDLQAWLCEHPFDEWLASDGDVRFDLPNILQPIDAELSAEWAELIEAALEEAP